MKLDSFDLAMLEEAGDAQEILQRMLGLKVSYSNAKKYLTGVRKFLEYKREMVDSGIPMNEMDEVEHKADGSHTTKRMVMLSETDALDPQRVMELMGYDPLQWALVNCKTRRNYWDVSMKMGSKQDGYYAEKHTNHAYMCTLTVKPIQLLITSDYIRQLFAEMKPPKARKVVHQAGEYLLELPLMDFHLGKLGWGEETGQDYDMTIAAERWEQVVTQIVGKVKQFQLPIERVIFPVGQDFFHMDTTKTTTTKGTPLDSDTRWQKMYRRGIELLTWAVVELLEVAPVECMWVGGNHDQMLSYTATCHLDGYFREWDDVTVDLSAQPRKYVEYGQCLIGFSHGEDEGRRIEDMMQVEVPEMWGRTRFREWHLGHLHKRQLMNEEGGVLIRRISTISGTDAWAAKVAFKGSILMGQAFVWDKERGIDTIIQATV